MSEHSASFPLPGDVEQFEPHPVDAPEIRYGAHGVFLDYRSRDDSGWVRVVFNRWDSIRVSRGEYPPYHDSGGHPSALAIVRPSSWLRERHSYESRHYGSSYGFGADVNEMLTEFEHYVFFFHDEFVEVIAGGVHFDTSVAPASGNTLHSRPGWAPLPDSAHEERWQFSGISYRVRSSLADRAQIVEASQLCDQVLVDLAPELDGRALLTHSLRVRTRDGRTVSRWRDPFGRVERTFKGVPEIDELRPLIESDALRLRQHRDSRGLS